MREPGMQDVLRYRLLHGPGITRHVIVHVRHVSSVAAARGGHPAMSMSGNVARAGMRAQ